MQIMHKVGGARSFVLLLQLLHYSSLRQPLHRLSIHERSRRDLHYTVDYTAIYPVSEAYYGHTLTLRLVEVVPSANVLCLLLAIPFALIRYVRAVHLTTIRSPR